jgi:hypothetical protein
MRAARNVGIWEKLGGQETINSKVMQKLMTMTKTFKNSKLAECIILAMRRKIEYWLFLIAVL